MPLLMTVFTVFTTAVLLISTRKIGESVRREREMKESNDGNKKTEKKRR